MNIFYDFSIEVLITETITLKDVRDELAGEIEYMMNQYFEENDIDNYDAYYPIGFADDFINDDIFLKCIGLSTGKTTIEAVLEQYEYYLEVQESQNILEQMDFDWDSYCKYYHDTTVTSKKEIEVSFCDRTFIVFEAWPDVASGTICIDDEGCNMLFDNYEEAAKEAANCQCGMVLEV